MPEDLSLLLTTRIMKMADWKTTFVSEHLNTDQSQLTKCFALVACFACCSLGDSSFQRCPGKPCNERKTQSITSLMCSFKHVHICINTNAKMCLNTPLFKETVGVGAGKFWEWKDFCPNSPKLT